MANSDFASLVKVMNNIDWDRAPEPLRGIMEIGRQALAGERDRLAGEQERLKWSDRSMFLGIANLDEIDRFLDLLIAMMRDELKDLTSQELAKITEETGGGVLATTYRSLAAETLRLRLS